MNNRLDEYLEYLYVTGDSRDTYKFTTNTEERNNITPNYKALIDILYDEKLNRIGMARTDLSKSWYDRHKHDEKLFDEFRKHTYNFFYNKCISFHSIHHIIINKFRF